MAKRMKRINLGSGNNYDGRLVNVDCNDQIKADVYMDVLDFLRECKVESTDYILASHILEHFDGEKVVEVLSECHRVLTKKGTLEIIVPDCTTKYGLVDPTHKSLWTDKTIDYFCGKNRVMKYFNFRFTKVKQLVWGFDTDHLNIHIILQKAEGADVIYNKAKRDSLMKQMKSFVRKKLK